MLGKRKAQRDLFDVGHVFPLALDPESFHGQLAVAAERLFRDEDFAAFYAECPGPSSTPPSPVALLVGALATGAAQAPECWAHEHDLGRYFGPSLKGSADLDWSDPEARNQFLAEIVPDARRLLRLAGAALTGDAGVAVREAAALLEQLLLQDVVETPDGAGGMKAAIKAGTAPERIPSATDPEQRHGRKAKSKRVSGDKASVAVDVEHQLILDPDVLAGSAR